MGKTTNQAEEDDTKRGSVTVRLPVKLIEALESYRNSQRFPPSKQVVFERLLEDLLQQHGFWPPKE